MGDEQPVVPPSRPAKLRRQQWAWAVTAGCLVLLGAMAYSDPTAVGFLIAAIVAIVGMFAIAIVRFQREARRFIVDNHAAITQIARGELDRARDTMYRWAAQTKQPRIAAVARHNLGWTLLRSGELQEAIDVFVANEKDHAKALAAVRLAPTSAIDLALAYALAGDSTAAERWVAETETRAEVPGLLSVPAMIAFVRAIVDCRRGRHAEAAALLDARWGEYEAITTGEVLRPIRVVRAFALGGAGPRNAGMADAALASSRPSHPGEYRFLGVAWPEMAAFIATHGLQ
jgi:hypothetical protein